MHMNMWFKLTRHDYERKRHRDRLYIYTYMLYICVIYNVYLYACVRMFPFMNTLHVSKSMQAVPFGTMVPQVLIYQSILAHLNEVEIVQQDVVDVIHAARLAITKKDEPSIKHFKEVVDGIVQKVVATWIASSQQCSPLRGELYYNERRCKYRAHAIKCKIEKN